MPCVMKREEEYKRLSEALAEDGSYNAVGFAYGSDYYDPSEPTEEEEPSKQRVEKNEPENAEENEEPFIAPLGLNVPSDVELPPTAKMHAIIERTANFVCKQGAQFEIMLKAKQARNSQFDFLRFDHYLNPYYKHIQKAMKEGRYTVLTENKGDEKKNSGVNSDDDDDDDDDGNYLHPSLFASKKCSRLEELVKPLKVVDPDHPLAALVRKAQADSNAAPPQPPDGAAVQTAQVEYTADSTVAAMYYSYYMLPDGTYCLAPPPPGIDVATYYSALPAGVTVSSTTGVTTAPPPPGTTPPPPPTTTESSSGVTTSTSSTSPLTPVVAIIPPPPDIQPVIDKLAEYVARNGIKFETSVRAKNDQRFEFLQPWHQYNPYYEFKKQFFLQKEGGDSKQAVSAPEETPAEPAPESSSEAVEEPGSEESDDVGGKGATAVKKDASASKVVSDGKLVKASFAPICFAIKAKENDLLPLEKNRVKLDDDSDEEEEGKEGQESSTVTSTTNPTVAPPSLVVEEKKPQLTQEELEAKQAKQKLEDRLAAAAREKLAQASKESKEKQLQAERKRKAALFLQTLKNPLAEAEMGKIEENPFSVEEVNNMPCTLLAGVRPLPTLEVKPSERPSSKCKDPPRTEEKEKKKKKHKKRSRTRSRSPSKYHSSSKSRSRSHSKAKHSLPSAYRTVRRSRPSASTGTLSPEPCLSSSSMAAATDQESYQAASTTKRFASRSSFEGKPGKMSRSRSRSPRRRAHTPERRREERSVPTAYRMSNSPGISRKRTRSRSPHEKKKKRRSRSRTKSKARSPSGSPSKQSAHKNSAHSASISPVESRESSQERSRGVSQEKDGQISSAIVSSVQSKITQDLMAKVRAMLAASKNIQTSAS
ncbi:splicing factor, suppressor of white-apricot homolog isoform X3 [Ornithorhynchus anatinus]|uniref:splicing factor, suppressor of white-apricot homolog isoform X3 n=1 Tax=Ornithorhynchus anatinus TaxID=9258 RepID=UPI0010A8EE95|nr:splicing factor, suppressor of white-apricot homolog isoform X3 [Ornithorhynchus anatinus]XP_028904447.1 splicing factor, suppressor of white-apricot homolog isoform X3 [Ornithorhynchus anatinus]XP_039766183.1 splicing factor, suppressor of white-apricot homolog isoform X3 [Ornithorhynchus anatinus]